eukprot:1692558-Alexandrium_andersonii.AAC.1
MLRLFLVCLTFQAGLRGREKHCSLHPSSASLLRVLHVGVCYLASARASRVGKVNKSLPVDLSISASIGQ